MLALVIVELSSTTGSADMRPFLLILVLVAVVLILTGSGIALLTLRRRQKMYREQMNPSPLESERT